MDSKGVSPMIATIALIAMVFVIAAIMALGLASGPQPSAPFGGSLILENVENGRDVIVIKHTFGDRAPDVVENSGGTLKWRNLELRVNGEIVPATKIIEMVSEGRKVSFSQVTTSTLFSMVVGDLIRVELDSPLKLGDTVLLKWVPKNQALVEKEVYY